MNKICNKQTKNKNDDIHTPLQVAKLMIDLCDLQPGQKVLDCCFGGGVFYNNYPDFVEKDYCDINQGKDFFDWDTKVDWVISNPPYSKWDAWLEHTMKICDNFCYIFGFMNFSERRLNRIFLNGFGLVKLHVCSVDWYFGRSIIGVFKSD